MELDWLTGLIGLMFTLIILAPLVGMHFYKLRREQALLRVIQEDARGNKGSIDTHECCGDIIAGVDEQQGTFYFFKRSGSNLGVQQISLEKYKRCRVLRKNLSSKPVEGQTALIEELELLFEPVGKEDQVIRFLLYHIDDQKQLVGELQFAERWSRTFNEQVLKES
jgi:hypothetical protein